MYDQNDRGKNEKNGQKNKPNFVSLDFFSFSPLILERKKNNQTGVLW
jgi:hypothetical protein